MGNARTFKGERLRAIREMRGMTQDDLGRVVGTSGIQIYRYENGKTEPATELLVGIARALEVTTDYLLGLVDDVDERLQEEGLSPEERALLAAFRRRDALDLMRIAVKSAGVES